MSANKTIKALRDQRKQLQAEIFRLQVALSPEAIDRYALMHTARIRALRANLEQDKAISALTRAIGADWQAPVHMLLGYGSAEEMQAAQTKLKALGEIRADIDAMFEALGRSVDPGAPGSDKTMQTTFQGGQVLYAGPAPTDEPARPRNVYMDGPAFIERDPYEVRMPGGFQDCAVKHMVHVPLPCRNASAAIEWRDAPKDATHCYPSGLCWYKFDAQADTLSCWFDGAWAEPVSASLNRHDGTFDLLVARPAPSVVWSISRKDGEWNYDTLAELIREHSDTAYDDHVVPGRVVYRAHKRYDDPAGYVPDAGEVIEHMGNRAHESDAGQFADDYPDLKDEARAALEVALEPLRTWARKYADPSHFTVHGITQHTITDDDIEAALAAQDGDE